MTDKKLTDEQLIELLQYKSKTGCKLCDIKNGDWCKTCNYGLVNNALDLINRQKAEIERLKASQDCEFMDSCGVPCEVMKRIVETEIDKLNAEKNDVMYHKDQIKAETIKEFAERADSMFAKIENELPKNKIVKATIQVYKDMLQIVKKEMVGERND